MLRLTNLINKTIASLSHRSQFLMEAKAAETKKNTAKRDKLIDFEHRAQYIWRRENFARVDPDFSKPKYFETFPYPYMNGRLHLGHGYSLTKCDFNARYKKLRGFNVLFPFGFHCTGMPICAAAQKLKRELELYGNPQKLPAEVQAELKKDGKQSQYQILQQMGIESHIMENFVDPQYWCKFFPPYGKQDIIRLGGFVDFDRSFITTSLNPYYDSFIQWQFNKLKERGYVKFGKRQSHPLKSFYNLVIYRPSIFSPKDNQMCADHDRAEGEGVNPKEYTLVKLQVAEANEILNKAGLKDRKVFLVAATLRPETMYGQTNCYLLPDGDYHAFQMKNDEVFICSERSARNMSFQDLTRTERQVEKIASFKGSELLGLPLKAPLSKYPIIYALPMMTISMNKGTGVVTSVPSDSPDDWAALNDLRNKKALRDKYGITEDMVKLDPVQIIEIPGLGKLAAIKACEDLKIKGQNDTALLAQAKDMCYTKGFYDGVMLVGNFAGKKVNEAKDLVEKELIEAGLAAIYNEPDGRVISRSGDECVVTYLDQWYLNYANEDWKNKIREHLKHFKTNGSNVLKEFTGTVDWIREWGCSRSFGLGTKLPFDDRYLIESLSDSTIYMAFYTIAHHLQGNLDGTKPGLMGIKPSDLSADVWDYIFLDAPYKPGSIPECKLKIMKTEFNYWYPMDLRCSGKDLIKNHLTMSLFNHAAIWENQPDKWPRGFYCNGYIMLDGEKMSKSKGNFLTVDDVCKLYGADAARFACATAGDTLDDANFTHENANGAIMHMSAIQQYIEKATEHLSQNRSLADAVNDEIKYFDKVFENKILDIVREILIAYQDMRYRDVIKFAAYELTKIKDEYLLHVEGNTCKELIETYIYYQLLTLYPICPHFGEVVYLDYFLRAVDASKYPKYLGYASFPELPKIESSYIKSHKCITDFLSKMREAHTKALKANKNKEHKFAKVTIIYRKDYQPFQMAVLNILSTMEWENNAPKGDWKTYLAIEDKMEKVNALKFGSFVIKEYQTHGADVLATKLPFDEFALLNIFERKIVKEFNVKVEIVEVNDVKSKDKVWVDSVNNTNPGKATVIFE